MNAPDRFELFVLPEGRRKVAVAHDAKVPHAATFILEREDHTLGNTLCRQLQGQPGVVFAGYRVPHPLEHNVELRVQTDGTHAPEDAVRRAVDALIGSLSILEERVKAEVRAVSARL